VDKGGIIHVSFASQLRGQQLVDNLADAPDAINRARPSGAKGQYLKA